MLQGHIFGAALIGRLKKKRKSLAVSFNLLRLMFSPQKTRARVNLARVKNSL
jgi:hypothetical protein